MVHKLMAKAKSVFFFNSYWAPYKNKMQKMCSKLIQIIDFLGLYIDRGLALSIVHWYSDKNFILQEIV